MKDIPFDPYDFFGYLSAGLLVLAALELLIGIPTVIGQEHKAFDLALIVLSAYIAGQIVATPAKALLEDLIARKALGAPTSLLITKKSERSRRRFVAPGYFAPLDETVRSRVLARAEAEGLATPSGESLFQHVRFRENMLADALLAKRLDLFLSRYGFARNLSFVSLSFSAAVLIRHGVDTSSVLTRYAVVAMVGGILLFYRFLKFYRLYAFELLSTYAGKK